MAVISAPTISDPPQGDAVLDDAQVVSEIKQSVRRSADAIIRGFDSTVVFCFLIFTCN